MILNDHEYEKYHPIACRNLSGKQNQNLLMILESSVINVILKNNREYKHITIIFHIIVMPYLLV